MALQVWGQCAKPLVQVGCLDDDPRIKDLRHLRAELCGDPRDQRRVAHDRYGGWERFGEFVDTNDRHNLEQSGDAFQPSVEDGPSEVGACGLATDDEGSGGGQTVDDVEDDSKDIIVLLDPSFATRLTAAR